MFLYDALAVAHIITSHPVRAEGLVSAHNKGLTEFKCVLLYLSVISAACLMIELGFPSMLEIICLILFKCSEYISTHA